MNNDSDNKERNNSLNDKLIGKELKGRKDLNSSFGLIDVNTRSASFDFNFNSLSAQNEKLKKDKHLIIPVGNRIETYLGKLYQIIVSTNITTVFIENTFFSYLTNPQNDNHNFFLMREADYFDIDQWEPSMTGNRISEEKMEEFVTQLNFYFSANEIYTILESNRQRKRIYSIMLVIGLLFLVGSAIVLWRIILTVHDNKALIVIFGIISLILILLNLRFIYYFCFSKKEEVMTHEIYTCLLQRKEIIEDYIQKWNDEYFREQGVVAYSTSIANYIHFSLESDKVIVLSNNKL